MEQCAIALGISLAEACPFLKVAQFGPQNGGLQGIQAAIESQKFVVILRPAAVVSKDAKAIGKMRIISGDHAAVACATQVLRRKEAETTERSQTSGRLPLPPGSNRLRGIFNNRQPPGLGDLKDCIHLRRQPEQMDRHDCASSSRYRFLNLPRVEIKVIRTDVDQDWPGAKPSDRSYCGHKGEGRSDHFIARPDFQGHQSKKQRVRTRSATNGTTTTNQACQLRLERLDFGTKNELLTLENSFNRLEYLLTHAREFRVQVKERELDVWGNGGQFGKLLAS